SPLPDSLSSEIAQELMKQAAQPPQMSPKDQADVSIKQATSKSTIARNIAGAIKDLSQAGVQGPGPDEEIRKQAVDALLQSGQSTQDHNEAMQQSQLEHQQALQQNAQTAALAPEPATGA